MAVGRSSTNIVSPPAAHFLITELIQRGVSLRGAQRLAAGEIVESAGDRYKLMQILTEQPNFAAARSEVLRAISVDPSDPSGNTVYIGGASGGIWKHDDALSRPGTDEF